jgi:hypothetical protein
MNLNDVYRWAINVQESAMMTDAERADEEWLASKSRADILRLRDSHKRLLAAAREALDAWNDKSGMGTVYSMTSAASSLRAAIAAAEEQAL